MSAVVDGSCCWLTVVTGAAFSVVKVGSGCCWLVVIVIVAFLVVTLVRVAFSSSTLVTVQMLYSSLGRKITDSRSTLTRFFLPRLNSGT